MTPDQVKVRADHGWVLPANVRPVPPPACSRPQVGRVARSRVRVPAGAKPSSERLTPAERSAGATRGPAARERLSHPHHRRTESVQGASRASQAL